MILTTTLAVALTLSNASQWIWAEGTPQPKTVFFRKTIQLEGKPVSVRLDITCDDAYILYVNGHKAAENASWYVMQSVDLTSLLHAGKNVIAVEGKDFGSAAGLLVDGSIQTSSGQVLLQSDQTWLVSTTPVQKWQESEYSDAGWLNAKQIGPEGIDPWGKPKREKDLILEMTGLKPAKPLSKKAPSRFSPDTTQGYIWSTEQTGIKGQFVSERIRPSSISSKIGTSITKPTTVTVDFGREIGGWVEVEVTSSQSPELKIEVGEAQTPQGLPSTFKEQKGNSTIFRLYSSGMFTGFRFAWLHFNKVPSEIKIKRVEAVWRMWPANYVGDFECSDPLLNQIWHVGAYTAHLNLAPDGFGAILRPERGDRFPWMGDDRVTLRTVMDVFGAYDLAKADLDFYVQPGQKDILINGIPGYTLDWVIALHGYWMQSGDVLTAKKRLPDVKTILESFGSSENPPGWLFTDWIPALQTLSEESLLAFHTKYYHAARLASEMAASLGDSALSTDFAELASQRQVYLEKHSRWSDLPQHALSNAILAGLKTSYPSSLPSHTPTPYFSYFVLEALSQVHQDQRALDAIRTYWGGMIKLGATSTWEYFDTRWLETLKPLQQPPDVNEPGMPSFFVSLCHPWSSGATPWLSDHVLGVTPTKPGYAECQVKPFFGDLKWARGKVATPQGPILVSWTRKDSNLTFKIQCPKGVKANVVLPSGRYQVDGKDALPAARIDGSVTFSINDSLPHTVSRIGSESL